MKHIESVPRGLSPEEIEKIIEGYKPLSRRIEEEQRFNGENVGSDLHRHIMGNAAPMLSEGIMRFMLNNPENQDKISRAADLLERYFRLLDENPELAQKIKVEGWSAFPNLKEKDTNRVLDLVAEFERIIEQENKKSEKEK